MAQKNIIYSVSASRGVGLWTSICRAFAGIFGVGSKHYDWKVKSLIEYIEKQLESYMRQHPNYDFEYHLVSDGTLSFVGTVKGTLREKAKPVEVILPAQPEPVVEQPVEEPVSVTPEKPSVVEEEPVVRDKNSYKVEERIVLNQDYEFDGVKIAKGSKGVIDNALYTSGGRTYIVIFDKLPGKEIKITGDYFE